MRIAVVIVALTAGTAMAEPPGLTLGPPGMTPMIEPPAPPLEPSYRGQTAAVDGATLGLIVLAASAKSDSVAEMALGSYLLGAPLVHAVHHRPGRAAGSLALRAGLPILGIAIGLKSVHPCNSDACDEGPGAAPILGMVAGMIAASVIDTAFLAKGDEAPARASWTPTIAARRESVSLGIAASF